MFGIYGEKCGKSWEQVSNDHKASVYYSAAEAIAYGFVDEVIHDDESAGNGEEEEEEENAGDEDDESTSTAETGNNDEENDESPTGEEGEDEDEETAPAAGMTGSRLNLKTPRGPSACVFLALRDPGRRRIP